MDQGNDHQWPLTSQKERQTETMCLVMEVPEHYILRPPDLKTGTCTGDRGTCWEYSPQKPEDEKVCRINDLISITNKLQGKKKEGREETYGSKKPKKLK